MRKDLLKLHPRLVKVYSQVGVHLLDVVAQALADRGLFNKEKDEPVAPLTAGGVEVLGKSLARSAFIALAGAELNEPSGFQFDEMDLVSGFVQHLQTPIVKVDPARNALTVEFEDPGAIIRRLKSPLDVERALVEQKGGEPIIQVEIGKRQRFFPNKIVNMDTPQIPGVKKKRKFLN